METLLQPLVLYIVVGVLLLLEVILLIWVYRLSSHYNSLTKNLEQKTLTKYLDGIQKTLSQHERTQLITKSELNKLTQTIKTHLQTLILKRFNPFGDTGGDQSFILALLDGFKDGVVITSLHSRENTRFYVKSVKGGVGIDHPLSSEEQKIIKR